MALRVRGVRVRDVHGVRRRPDRVPLRARAEVEVPAMAEGCPLVSCSLCDLVPGRPDRMEDGSWRIVCPMCGREAVADFEADVRGVWLTMNERPPAPLSPALELLDSIEAAMCDLEAIRIVPGAMSAWCRWMDDLEALRSIVREAQSKEAQAKC